MDEITLEITFALENAAKIYSESPANTNSAVILRIIDKLILASLRDLFYHKLN